MREYHRPEDLFHDRRGEEGYRTWTKGAGGGVSPTGKEPEGARVDEDVHLTSATAKKALRRRMQAGAEKRR
jgi:hypothetical protein